MFLCGEDYVWLPHVLSVGVMPCYDYMYDIIVTLHYEHVITLSGQETVVSKILALVIVFFVFLDILGKLFQAKFVLLRLKAGDEDCDFHCLV